MQVTLEQTSVESPAIFSLLLRAFNGTPVAVTQAAATAAGVTGAEWELFITYASNFFANSGNYKVALHHPWFRAVCSDRLQHSAGT